MVMAGISSEGMGKDAAGGGDLNSFPVHVGEMSIDTRWSGEMQPSEGERMEAAR